MGTTCVSIDHEARDRASAQLNECTPTTAAVNEFRPRVRHVIGPRGRRLTLADLPLPDTKRWVIRRKAEVIAALRGGLLSLEEACSRYALHPEEVLSWQHCIDRFGFAGLRTTRTQFYRRKVLARLDVPNVVASGTKRRTSTTHQVGRYQRQRAETRRRLSVASILRPAVVTRGGPLSRGTPDIERTSLKDRF